MRGRGVTGVAGARLGRWQRYRSAPPTTTLTRTACASRLSGAFLENVGPNVRAVAVSYRGQTIVFDALLEPEATDEERQDLEDVATDVIADYPSGRMLEVNMRSGVDDLPHWPARVFQRSSD
jgi:hypothetical protein